MVLATVLSSKLTNCMHSGVQWHECNAMVVHLQCVMAVRQCSAVACGASAVPRNPLCTCEFYLVLQRGEVQSVVGAVELRRGAARALLLAAMTDFRSGQLFMHESSTCRACMFAVGVRDSSMGTW